MIGVVDNGQKNIGNGLIVLLDAANLRSVSGSGTAWTNIGGGPATASLLNSPTWTTSSAEKGGAFLFNGTNTRWELRGFIPRTGAFTIEMIYKNVNNSISLDSLCSSGNYWDISANSLGYGFATDNSNLTSFTLVSTSTYSYAVDLRTSVTDGAIYHLAGTRAYRGSNEFIVGYVNGVPTGSATGSNGFNLNISGGFYAVNNVFDARNADILGTYCWSYGGVPTGSLYLVRIYNRELSASEIKTNYEATKTRFGI